MNSNSLGQDVYANMKFKTHSYKVDSYIEQPVNIELLYFPDFPLTSYELKNRQGIYPMYIKVQRWAMKNTDVGKTEVKYDETCCRID